MEMVSKSVQVLLLQDSVIRAMPEEGERLRREYGNDKVYDFSLGSSNVPALTEAEQAIREVSVEGPSVPVHGYVNNAGFADLRTVITDSLQERFGLAYHADQLVMTTGVVAALNILLKTVLSPGDEALTSVLYSSGYKNYVQNYDGVLRFIVADSETFLPDLDALRKTISEKTRALVLNTLNNPSGVVYSEEVSRDIQGVLAEKEWESGGCILVISDEPYREFVYDGATAPRISVPVPHVAVVYSYSETPSLPGERIGWLFPPGSTPEARELYAVTVIANRISGFANAPSLIQRVLKRTLDCRADFSVYEHNRTLLLREPSKIGYRLVKSEGAFYLLIQVSEGDDAALAVTLKEECILTVPCKSFTCPGYVRLAYCAAETTVRNALPDFRRTAESYKAKGLL